MVVQPGLCRTWSETPKTGFLTTRLILFTFENDQNTAIKTEACTSASEQSTCSDAIPTCPINISLGFVLVTLPHSNLLTFFITYVSHLMLNNTLVCYTVTYQRILIRYGTGDFYLKYDKRVLRADFRLGFQITYQVGNKKYKSTMPL